MVERGLHLDPQADDGSEGVVVAADASWFKVSSGDRVTLARREALRRTLLALVEARRRAPGRLTSREELIEAGWPNERVLPEAAANRLRVAVATLRRLGLAEVLETGEGGYLLNPDHVVRVVPAEDCE